MKTNLKDILAMATLCLTLFANTAPTWAGFVNTPEVSIGSFLDVQYASGSMVGARYSKDSKQYIGCEVLSYGTNGAFVSCGAQNSAGSYFGCTSATNQEFVDALQSMTDSSYIYFIARSPGVCQKISISHSSENLR